MEGLDEILKEFIVETYEGLDHFDRDLLLLEEDPSADDVLSRAFRTIHTIKGSSGFLALAKLEAVAHVGENLLSLLRDHELDLTPEITSALLSMADALREIVGNVERTESEGDADHAELIATLTDLATPDAEKPERQQAADATASVAIDEPVIAIDDSAEEAPPIDREETAGCAEPVTASEPSAEADPRPTSEAGRTSAADATIRVDVDLLDTLMNLVGELVLARNQILQQAAIVEDAGIAGPLQRLNMVANELQEGVMKTRMQPIGNVWSKFPRVVRDLALSCGKNVRIEMDGRETEIDKTILESIKDPLTHAIRNAVDHGIEAPDRRRELSKPEEGRIQLRAYHESGQVNIVIADDGGGIDPEKVRAKAIGKGLVTSAQASQMSDKELVNLITLPGFSTAEQVTNVSGRGVGMDVVRTNIEQIGGRIDIHSVVGQGTTLKIKIPLTLAIIPALTVASRGERFAIPQVNLLELVRLDGEHARQIERIGGVPVYRLRGKLLPLAFLDAELGLTGRPCDDDDGKADGALNIVVLQAGESSFGLVVDRVYDTEEIVVKSLGQQLKGVSAFAGAAIMGDGRVALILDVVGLAHSAAIIGGGSSEAALGDTQVVERGHSEHGTLLLIGNSDGTRCALPLSEVARLEEIDRDCVESSGGHDVVQYRGEVMPLVCLPRLLGHEDGAAEDRMHVVVVRRGDRQLGIHVSQILDTVDHVENLAERAGSSAVRAVATVQGRVTDILDIEGIANSALSLTPAVAGEAR